MHVCICRNCKNTKQTFTTVKPHSWKRKLIEWDKSIRILNTNDLPTAGASLPHWLFWEDTEVGSALKTSDFPEQVLHVAHQLGTLRKGTDSSEILHILSVVTLLFFQQETNQQWAHFPPESSRRWTIKTETRMSFSQVLDCPGSALCSYTPDCCRGWEVCAVTHQDKKE